MKNILKIIWIIIILSLLIQFVMAKEEIVLSIELNYSDGNFSLNNISLKEGYPSPCDSEGYTAKLTSFKNEILYSCKFKPDFVLLEVPPREGKPQGSLIVQSNQKIGLVFPYYNNAKSFMILDNSSKVLLEIDISTYATCNENNICDNKETHELCPEECLCGDGKCGDGETYKTCSQDCPYVPEKRENMTFWQRILYFIKSLFT